MGKFILITSNGKIHCDETLMSKFNAINSNGKICCDETLLGKIIVMKL